MAIVDEMTEAGGASPPATVMVWDPLVRVFHWAVAALFGLAFVTGDEVEGLHIVVAPHILGVLFACFEHRKNLVKAILIGRKRAE